MGIFGPQQDIKTYPHTHKDRISVCKVFKEVKDIWGLRSTHFLYTLLNFLIFKKKLLFKKGFRLSLCSIFDSWHMFSVLQSDRFSNISECLSVCVCLCVCERERFCSTGYFKLGVCHFYNELLCSYRSFLGHVKI